MARLYRFLPLGDKGYCYPVDAGEFSGVVYYHCQDLKGGTMEQKHKDFILNELIPFIRRNEGRNFIMEDWLDNYPTGITLEFDGVRRKLPKDCGTVCCIGGSIQAIKLGEKLHFGASTVAIEKTSSYIGLSDVQARGLFVHWRDDQGTYCGYGWPENFRRCFAKATTAECKAEVACALLEKVVETEGACLEEGWKEEK